MTARVAPPAKPVRGAVDPRIRARRAGVLRAQARRRAFVALGVLALSGVVAGSWFLLHSRVLSARVVTVVGSVHTPYATVVRAAGLDGAPPLLDVGASATAGVDRLPWVRSATVSRQWPDGVLIDVHERVPAAVVSGVGAGHELALVDRTGKVLALVSKRPGRLVEVIGRSGPARLGSVLSAERGALEVATSLPRAFAHQVADVGVGQGGDVTLRLGSSIGVDLGSPTHLAQKYEDVAAILSRAQLVQGDVIDVSAPGVPVVAPPQALHAPAS